MDIGLDSWMEEHLTKTAGLLGFMPGPAILFSIYICSFFLSNYVGTCTCTDGKMR